MGTVTAHAARFLEAAVAAGLNIIVAGGTQAGQVTTRSRAGIEAADACNRTSKQTELTKGPDSR